MKSGFKIILWIAVAGFGVAGVLIMTGALDTSGSDAAGRGIAGAIGLLFAINAAIGAAILLLLRRWRGVLWVAAVILGLPFALVAFLSIASSLSSAKNRHETEDMHSGRAGFAQQPALLAVAEAISRNDEAGLRSAAKAVPDLQASGRDGKTLLFFAIDEALGRPQLVKAVEVLLSLGANPNFTNDHAESYAMARAAHGPILLLRVMLDAGGDPNARDEQGKPIIFGNWQMTYFEADRHARFILLLDRGADLNSIWPESVLGYAGYTLAMYRASMGRGDADAFSDTLELLQRGADFRHAAKDGTTLMSIMHEHRKWFSEQHETPPGYQPLWDWLKSRDPTP